MTANWLLRVGLGLKCGGNGRRLGVPRRCHFSVNGRCTGNANHSQYQTCKQSAPSAHGQPPNNVTNVGRGQQRLDRYDASTKVPKNQLIPWERFSTAKNPNKLVRYVRALVNPAGPTGKRAKGVITGTKSPNRYPKDGRDCSDFGSSSCEKGRFESTVDIGRADL